MESWFVHSSKKITRRQAAIALVASGCLGACFSLAYLVFQLEWGWPWCSQSVQAAENMIVDDEPVWTQVSGAVERPGVYSLPAKSLWTDAISAAGGLSTAADKEYIEQKLNLAQELSSHSKIHLPTREENQFQSDAAAWCDRYQDQTDQENADKTQLISVNTASQSELESLTGIGAVRAVAIIDGRPYASLGELVEKGVISQSLFDEIAAEISL